MVFQAIILIAIRSVAEPTPIINLHTNNFT